MLVVSEFAAGVIRQMTDHHSEAEESGLRIIVGPTAFIRTASLVRGQRDGDLVCEAPGGVLVFVDGRSVGAVRGHELDASVGSDGAVRFVLRPRGARHVTRLEHAA